MAFGIYIHIPYCEHRCSYCDFTTFAASKLMPISDYVDLLIKEIEQRSEGVKTKKLDTIYFGGGTPSLLEPRHILTLFTALAKHGFMFDEKTEITLEMNPSSAEKNKIDSFIDLGINRFSVGAQSFNKKHLNTCERIHTRDETIKTLEYLSQINFNYSLDILYGLPYQTLSEVLSDLEIATSFSPNHISSYLLTIPDSHKLNIGRPHEELQVEMFNSVIDELKSSGHEQYELSNFSKSGMESRHNSLYWSDQSYWGLGLSAHSYEVDAQSFDSNYEYGCRYWNPQSFKSYQEQLEGNNTFNTPYDSLPKEQKEYLSKFESLTDFCHMHLRTRKGIPYTKLKAKFPNDHRGVVSRLKSLQTEGLIVEDSQYWALSHKGQILSNQVFESLLFKI